MSQKKAKLINKYLVATGLKGTGYVTNVTLSGKLHTCFHSYERAIKREYNRANHFRKLDLTMRYNKVINSKQKATT